MKNVFPKSCLIVTIHIQSTEQLFHNGVGSKTNRCSCRTGGKRSRVRKAANIKREARIPHFPRLYCLVTMEAEIACNPITSFYERHSLDSSLLSASTQLQTLIFNYHPIKIQKPSVSFAKIIGTNFMAALIHSNVFGGVAKLYDEKRNWNLLRHTRIPLAMPQGTLPSGNYCHLPGS